MATAAQVHEVTIEIGGMAVCVRTDNDEFRRMVEERYAGFVPSLRDSRPSSSPLPGTDVPGSHVAPVPGWSRHDQESSAAPTKHAFALDIELLPQGAAGPDEDVSVWHEGERWVMTRGDFRAEYVPGERRGWVRQTANPYAIDSVLRILHTLLLAEERGFLLHAASAIRGGNAFLFSGKSEAGKTTLSRLAPSDVVLLTDEISYIRKGKLYVAYGTPFAGELAKVGDNVSAPVKALYFLEKAEENRTERIGTAEALFRLMQNILFFAEDERLVRQVFEGAGEFVLNVPAYRLAFAPDPRVWEMIG